MLDYFERLLELLDQYGYVPFLFVLFVMAASGAIVIAYRRYSATSQVTQPEEAPKGRPHYVSVEIRDRLSTVRDGLEADRVDLLEVFKTVDGDERGYDVNGCWVASESSRAAGSPVRGGLGQRVPYTSLYAGNVVPKMFEETARTGFLLVPDTRELYEQFPGIRGNFGLSYYVVAGHDLQGTAILGVVISFYDEEVGIVALTKDDLRPYVRDAQAIVALLLD